MFDTLAAILVGFMLSYVLARRKIGRGIIVFLALAAGLVVGYEALALFPAIDTSYYYLLQTTPMRIVSTYVNNDDILLAIQMQPFIKVMCVAIDGLGGLIGYFIATRFKKKKI